MSEYIDRKTALSEILEAYEFEFPTASGAFDEFVTEIIPNILHSIPTAYAAPARHGYWTEDHRCSSCHYEAFHEVVNLRPEYDFDWDENLVFTGNYLQDIAYTETDYCPNCGAKMDLEGMKDG